MHLISLSHFDVVFRALHCTCISFSGCNVEEFVIPVPCVDTYREPPIKVIKISCALLDVCYYELQHIRFVTLDY